MSLSPGGRFGRLLVERRRDARRAAPLRQTEHDDLATASRGRDLEDVPRANVLRRLDPRAVHMDMTARDRVGGRSARLEEARGPEPPVDSDIFQSGLRDRTL